MFRNDLAAEGRLDRALVFDNTVTNIWSFRESYKRSTIVPWDSDPYSVYIPIEVHL